jgi:hypothetical protein
VIRRWYVVVDETPVCPERPLRARDAVRHFLGFVEDDDHDQIVEIKQCDHDDMTWALGEDYEETMS